MEQIDELERWAVEICPGHPIDRGIVRAVKVLRDAGYATFEACEGGRDHAYAEPTVRFEGDDGAGLAAADLLLAADLPLRRVGRCWQVDHTAEGVLHRDRPFWEVAFRTKLS